jgi:uncharacterized protein
MNSPNLRPALFYPFACLFESALAVLALVLGWLSDVRPVQALALSEQAATEGLLATLPLLLLFFLLRRLSYPPVQQIQRLLRETLGRPLLKRSWADLWLLAAIAGISEELLFRGWLQPWLEHFVEPAVAMWICNTVFALVHAVTPLYTVLAGLMGAYLSWCLDWGGERNLLRPIVVHGLYDFVAFMIIVRECRAHARSET